jgi:TnpA family transposase
MPRMIILHAAERQAYEAPPILDVPERSRAFDVPAGLLATAKAPRKPAHRIGFLVSCAYFGVAKRFFAPKDYHARDIRHAAHQLELPATFAAADYPARTRQRHERLILQFHGYRRFDGRAEDFLAREVAIMAEAHLKPKLIFWRCLDLMARERVQLPGEHRLTALIAAALQRRKRQLAGRLEQLMTVELRDRLDDLFVQATPAADGAEPGRTSRYRLTLLKKLSQSTKTSEIRQRTNDLLDLKGMHEGLVGILSALGLGREGVSYYAGSVIRSEIFQLARRTDPDRYLHVIAFIAHQLYRMQDNLVDTLLTTLRSHQNACQREHKDDCYARRHERDDRLAGLLETIDASIVRVLRRIKQVVHDPALTDAEKVGQVRHLLPADNDNEPAAVIALRQELDAGRGDHDVLERRSLKLQNRIGPIIRVLAFRGEPAAAGLLAAIEHFKAKDGAVGRAAPHDFLEPAERAAVVRDGQVARISLYKALLFAHIARALKAGTLNLEHSYKYRPLDDYLIGKERWQREKEVLLARAALQDLTDPRRVLAELDEALHRQYLATNRRLAAGANPHLRVAANGRFKIATPKQDEGLGEPLQPFLPQRHVVPVAEILATVNRHALFTDELQHWQQRRPRRVRAKALYAGVMGLGCGIGTRRMARITQGVGEAELEHAVNWHFSLENVQAANDRILRLTSAMGLPEIHRRSLERLHTASDGQKFEVRKESLNANYSFKYFGRGRGVSAYSFIDERQLLWHSLVFSAAERESAYVIDGLMRNDVVKSDIHSTDSHGYSEAIFAAAHLLGISYAPRLKGLDRQILYTFRSRREVDRRGWAVTPDKYVNAELVEASWDDILRLITTIKLKETTASDIFRRLNSYAKQHVLYRALKAFGQIIKSLFILRYLDDSALRQAVEQQLSRIELANRFTRDVAVGSPREFLQAEKEDQEIAEACNRLIKNSIVCWNYLYLERKLATLRDAGRKRALLAAIAGHSMLAWAHVNLLGEYDFSDEKLRDSFGLRPARGVA